MAAYGWGRIGDTPDVNTNDVMTTNELAASIVFSSTVEVGSAAVCRNRRHLTAPKCSMRGESGRVAL
jgi:hypothetical protein